MKSIIPQKKPTKWCKKIKEIEIPSSGNRSIISWETRYKGIFFLKNREIQNINNLKLDYLYESIKIIEEYKILQQTNIFKIFKKINKTITTDFFKNEEQIAEIVVNNKNKTNYFLLTKHYNKKNKTTDDIIIMKTTFEPQKNIIKWHLEETMTAQDLDKGSSLWIIKY